MSSSEDRVYSNQNKMLLKIENLINLFLVKILLFVTLSTLFVNAQGNYGYGQVGYQSGMSYCDRGAYDRATNSLRLELQTRNSHNIAPYSYSSNGFQSPHNSASVSDDQCRNVRQSFSDLLQYTPICESIGSYQHQNAGQMLEQTRMFLKQYCERNQGYQHIQCYRVTEMHNCEQQFTYARQSHGQQQPVMHSSLYGNTYGNTGSNSYNITSGHYPTSPMLCGAYDQFKNCSIAALQRNCYRTDLEHTATYLMDQGHNLAFSCLPGSTPYNTNSYINPYNISGYNGYRRTDVVAYPPPQSPSLQAYPPPSVYSSGFSGRALPTNSDSSSSSSISRFDSLGINSHIETCIQTVKPFEGACTDLMIERQRDARHGRSSNDVQRRICCALFSYRDCLSRTVLERCIDGSTRVVEYLMGPRQQELSANCRDYTREQCSSATKLTFTIFIFLFINFLTKFF